MARSSRDPRASLRAFALGFPGATEEFPWGERVVKVARKVFVFLGSAEGARGVGLSVKLPTSHLAALGLPFTSPTGYGLGKSGWVSARFEPGEEVPVDLLTLWIEESYRAIAPRRLVAELDAGRGRVGAGPSADRGGAPRGRPAKKKAARKKAARKKAAKKKAAKKKARTSASP
jgi:predicted DNA-binding protein (MmcQ/YjbR family)